MLRHLPNEDIEDLALLLQERVFSVGDYVIRQGVRDDQLYIVTSGNLVASVIDSLGTETVLTAYEPGDTFGELTMLDMEPSPSKVSCLNQVRLYSLARADFFTLLYAKPQISVKMMRYLVSQIRQGTSLLMWVQQTNKAHA